MANDLSKLDYTQVIKSVYNEEANALQITNGAPIVAPSGSLELSINQEEDSIALGDGTDLFTSTYSSGKTALDVNIINSDTNTLRNVYNEVLSVASGVLTTVISTTIISDSKLKQIEVSGENIATYYILVDSNIICKKRTFYGGGLNSIFIFDSGLFLTTGQEILVQVIHNNSSLANFNSSLILIEE